MRNIILEKEGRKERGRKREEEWNRWRTGEERKKNGDGTERKMRYGDQMSEKRELRKMCAREGASERERPAQLRTTSNGELQSESAVKEYGVQREIALALRYHQKGDGEVSCLSFSLFLFLTTHTKGKNGDSRMQDGDAERGRKLGRVHIKKNSLSICGAPSVPYPCVSRRPRFP